ncbi:hypothetical protein [Nostoc sp.]|uniref:hypothetical protein n=1 Tax=Nostoc sp. TaxID=1180 RepID=UPI002FF74FA7
MVAVNKIEVAVLAYTAPLILLRLCFQALLLQEIDIYVYFNNDPDGHAIRDAQRLYSLLGSC